MAYDDEFVCVVDAKSKFRKALTIEQYLEAKHVAVNIQRGLQVAPDKHLAAQGYKRQVAIQVPYHEAAVRCVQRTSFIATVPRKFMEGMLQSAAIKVLNAPTEVGRLRHMMVWHPRLNSDSAHAWLRSTMRSIGEAIAHSKPPRRVRT